MNLKSNSKLKTAVLAGAFALAINNTVFADHYSVGSVNFDTGFTVQIDGASSMDGGGYYLTYSPNDRSVGQGSERFTLKGGELYIYSVSHFVDSDSSYNWISLGPVKGDDFSDEQLNIIKDLIAHVDGDQTVDGSQTVTGGQTISGGSIFAKSKALIN